jgi:hypothetical protein
MSCWDFQIEWQCSVAGTADRRVRAVCESESLLEVALLLQLEKYLYCIRGQFYVGLAELVSTCPPAHTQPTYSMHGTFWSEDGPHSVESVGSLQYSQKLATLTNHDAGESIAHVHTQFL